MTSIIKPFLVVIPIIDLKRTTLLNSEKDKLNKKIIIP